MIPIMIEIKIILYPTYKMTNTNSGSLYKVHINIINDISIKILNVVCNIYMIK